MNILLVIFAIAFGIAFLLILGSSIFIGGTVFRLFRKAEKHADLHQSAGGRGLSTHTHPDGTSHHQRVLEMLKSLPPGTEPYKCRKCGATVDSTAEISPTGDIKCNYCQSRTNLFV